MIVTPGQINDRANLYFQLASLLSAGVPVIQAIEMVRNTAPRAFREPLGAVVNRLLGGSTFTDALSTAGRWLPAFDLALFTAGEQSGRLDLTLRSLGNYYQERALTLRRMISSMVYPAFLFHMAVFIFPTSLLSGLFFSDGLRVFLLQKLAVLLPLYAFIFLLIVALQGTRGEKWRATIERITHAIPLLSGAQRDLAMARLSGALEVLLSAGVPIIRAWSLAAEASGSSRYKRAVAWALPQMESGVTPAETLRQLPIFPDLFQNLYASGELSGQLDSTLGRLHAHYRDEATLKIQNIAGWTPKLIFLIVALGIAYQIVSFYSGAFNQINQLGF